MQDPEDLYCGKDDCYGLLGLDRDADAAVIKKAYRKLALKWHPDKNRSPDAAAMFLKVGRANEVLSDEKIRQAYDYFLDHPEDRYTHYYRYYAAVYAPQTPLWMVVTGTLLFLSMLQYINQHWRYSRMMNAVKFQPSFKRRVNEVFEAEAAACKGKLNKIERDVLKAQVEKRIFETEVQLSGNGFAAPSLKSLIGARATLLPLTLGIAAWEAGRWHWRFSVKGEEYGEEENAYLTRKALGLSEGAWANLDEFQLQGFLVRQLWKKENMAKYVEEKTAEHEEAMEKQKQSGAYKRFKRFQRKG